MVTLERQSTTYTIREFLDAVEKNGFRKGRRGYIFVKGRADSFQSNKTVDPNEVVRACAFGQAALNLNIPAGPLQSAVALVNSELSGEIIRLNDNTGKSVSEIGAMMKLKYANDLDRKIEVIWYGRVS